VKGKNKITANYREQVDRFIDNQPGVGLPGSSMPKEMDEIWEEISIELDISDVWNKISSDLDIVTPPDPGPGIFFKACGIALIIMAGLILVRKAIPYLDLKKQEILTRESLNDQSSEPYNIENESAVSGTEKKVKRNIQQSIRSPAVKSNDSFEKTGTQSSRISTVQLITVPADNEIIAVVRAISGMSASGLIVSPQETTAERPENASALLPEGPEEEITIISVSDFDSLKIKDNPLTDGYSQLFIHRGRISVGLVTLFKNTWLLNHETFDGLRSESLNTTEIVFYPDVGLSLNYSLNRTWSLQADGFFYSNTGQEYLEYIYGHYSRKKITLKYSTVAFSVKYQFNRELFIPRSSINLLAGSYLSVLHHADQKINTDLKDIGSQYRKFDAGIRLGCELEFGLFDHLSLAPGLFVSLGIPNIYMGDGNIPGYLRRTYNGCEGFHLTICYHNK
jgi:hypothetical protein